MKRTKLATAAGFFQANPIWIAMGQIAGRVWIRMNSSIMAYSLDAPGLMLGPHCRIVGGRHISFGRNIYAHRNLWLEAVTSYQSQRFTPAITLGDHVSFSDGVHLSAISSIVIGNHVLMGSRVYISDHNHGTYKGERQSRPDEPPSLRVLGGGGEVTIGDNVWIGDNSVIVGPASIGKGAIIGANSVVRGVILPNSMVAGAPAKLIKVFNFQTGSWDRV